MIIKDIETGGTSGYAIFVNNNHHTHRRRFTIAHEIGHFVLHGDLIGDGIAEDYLLRADGFPNRIETEANKFAASLLMPRHLMIDYQIQGILSIPELAKIFNVSKDAMSIRLLGIPYRQAKSTSGP